MQVLMTVRKELYRREPARMRLAVFAQCCLIADAVLSEEAAQVPPPGCIMRHDDARTHDCIVASSQHLTHCCERVRARRPPGTDSVCLGASADCAQALDAFIVALVCRAC